MNNNWDNIESYLLKECYELAAQYEPLDTAKDILRARAKSIQLPDNYVPVQNSSFQSSPQLIASNALYELALDGYSESGSNSSYAALYSLNSLPPFAEKELVLALDAIRNDTRETARIDALRHIAIAQSYSPNNPIIRMLANILQSVDT